MVRFFVGLFMGIVLATAMSVYAVNYHVESHSHGKYDIVNFDREVKKVVGKVMWDHKNWDH
jgi:hypothetical protein